MPGKRPIVLTSVTTLVGLLPLMFNNNPVVYPLVPIAISLGFGVIFATMITLLLVPAVYLIVEMPRSRTKDRTSPTPSEGEGLTEPEGLRPSPGGA